jgi:lipopolysaccharide biosynthesis glycosyltransferase
MNFLNKVKLNIPKKLKSIKKVKNILSKPNNFDWKYYVNRYADLRKAGIDSEEKAIEHYLNYGKKEKRQIRDESKLHKPKSKNDKNQIHIACATDDNFAQHCAVMIYSLLKNTQNPKNINLYVLLTSQLKSENREKLEEIIKKYDSKITFIELEKKYFNNIPKNNTFTINAFSRIFIPDLIEGIDKIIYLDCDMLVEGDIKILWDSPMNGKTISAVHSHYLQNLYKNVMDCDKDYYFNSGVLVIDLVKFKENKIKEKVIEFVLKNQGKLVHPDQQALNFALHNDWNELPLEWNLISQYFNKTIKFDENISHIIQNAIKNIKIVHFAGDKPTSPNLKCDNPFREKYFQYLSLTPFDSSKNNEYINWFICLNDNSTEFITLAKKAICSAEKFKINKFCVYSGNNTEFIDFLNKHNTKIIRTEFSLGKKLIEIFPEKKIEILLATYLRIDLPEIIKKDNLFKENYFLYTDCDIIFLKDPSTELNKLKPKYFCASSEFQKEKGAYFNAGVMWINLENMQKSAAEFKNFLLQTDFNSAKDDQSTLNTFYGSKYDFLDIKFNWKPYWGINNDAFILHFHGPKPNLARNYLTQNTPVPVSYTKLLNEETKNYYSHYLNIYSKINTEIKTDCPKDFDWKYYVEHYKDLQKAGINSEEKAIRHYIKFGLKEKRKINDSLEIIPQVSNTSSKKYLSIFCMFRDSAPFLKEWIEYHLLIGVEHFYLYNNYSTDNYQEVLEPYVKQGLVDVIDWPFEPKYKINFTTPPGAPSPLGGFAQKHAINDCLFYRAKGQTKWLAIIDSDEFIVPKNTNDMKIFLKDYEHYGGLVVSWKVFGTSNVKTVEKNELMIEKLVYSQPENEFGDNYIKSIVQVDKVMYAGDSHYCVYKDSFYAVDSDKRKHLGTGKHHYPSQEKIILNHYFYRTENDFKNIKLKYRPGLINRLEKEKLDLANSTYNPSILRFVPELKKRIFGK